VGDGQTDDTAALQAAVSTANKAGGGVVYLPTGNVDPPWDVVPEVGSNFSITDWGADRWLVEGNQLTGNARGIMIYASSAHSVAIIGNTLTNSSGIWLQPMQNGPQRTTPLLAVSVLNNQVIDTRGFTGSFGALDLSVNNAQAPNPFGNGIFGTEAFGVEIRGNTVQGTIPNTKTVPGYHPYAEGFTAQTFFEAPSGSAVSPLDAGPPAVLGTIFQGNTAVNSLVGFTVGTGDLDTMVWSNTTTNTTAPFADVEVKGVPQTSANTVVGP
jgi:hypothetical protein